MYISRLKLEPFARKTREMLINPYTLHQAVYRAFPSKLDGGSGRVLYRVDRNRRTGAVSVLVQSEKLPDWNKAEYLLECLLETVECKRSSPSVVAGQCLRFRLRANPSIKKQADGKKHGYRIGILREEDQIKWLHKKAESCGFSLITCNSIPEGIVHDERGQQDKTKLSHYAVLFEGELKVVNPDTFITTLSGGIGSAKGFGFGLLSVAPTGN